MVGSVDRYPGCFYGGVPNSTGGFLRSNPSTNIRYLREDKQDGLSGMYLFESGVTNQFTWSNTFSDLSWVKTACSISGVASSSASPNYYSVFPIIFTASASAKIASDLARPTEIGISYNPVAGDPWTVSFWVRSESGTGSVRIYMKEANGTSSVSSNIPITTTWKRISRTSTHTTGVGACNAGVQNSSSGTAQTVCIWGAQAEVGATPTSYQLNSGYCYYTYRDGAPANNWLTQRIRLEQDYNFDFAPTFASSDNTNVGILQFGTKSHISSKASYTGLYLYTTWNSGHSRYEGTLAIREKGVDKYALPGLTWVANQVMKISVDMAAGTISVSGATSGDGTSIPGTPGWSDGVADAGTPEFSAFGLNSSGNARFGSFRMGMVRTSTTTLNRVSPAPTRNEIVSAMGNISYNNANSYRYNAPPNSTGGFLTLNADGDFLLEDKRDGLSGYFLCEGTRTNYLLYSKNFSQASWVKTLCTVGAGSTTAPDGLIDCKTVSFTASALAGLAATCPGITTNSQTVVCSVWARCAAGATNIRLSFLNENAVLTTSSDLPISATWTRVRFYVADTGTLGGVCAMGILNGTAGVAQDIELWGAQAEISTGKGDILTSNILTVGAAAVRQDSYFGCMFREQLFGGVWGVDYLPTNPTPTVGPSSPFQSPVSSIQTYTQNNTYTTILQVGNMTVTSLTVPSWVADFKYSIIVNGHIGPGFVNGTGVAYPLQSNFSNMLDSDIIYFGYGGPSNTNPSFARISLPYAL